MVPLAIPPSCYFASTAKRTLLEKQVTFHARKLKKQMTGLNPNAMVELLGPSYKIL
jgi:hypothetical protein